MKITLLATVLQINTEIDEALVKFNTGETRVVKLDEYLPPEILWGILRDIEERRRRTVEVEFDTKDEFLEGSIVCIIEGVEGV